MSEYIDLDALARVVVAAVVVGAGLPALFALGVRMLASRTVAVPGAGAGAEDAEAGAAAAPRPAPWRTVVAGACFAVIVGAIVLGIWFIAAGGH
ncbi:hypothetical protein [Cellulomonas sp. PhB143]|uniref:hypothetical protein n=1 Tax=Cellulomonas sp. PhB143 TaxID=2485186 RepID=UPI000F46FD6E|nr:hypothetical protein [Cellulomonas sp. PhB143]ROS73403.1 hypothetical protein EDF32_2671 [Cellulomonas sp. PhB143]